MQIDEIIPGIIREWEEAFPDLITAWYLLGSHTNKSAVSKSDIDLFFVLSRDASSKQDSATAASVVQKLKKRYSVPIETWGQTVQYLREIENVEPVSRELIHTVSIKLGSLHLKGLDIRDEINLPPIKKYVTALESVALGWIQKQDDDGNDTKRLVQIVLSCAVALAAKSGNIYISRKSEILEAYKKHVNDKWVPLIETVHEKLWQEWEYALPEKAEEQKLLKEIRKHAHEFENSSQSRFESAD